MHVLRPPLQPRQQRAHQRILVAEVGQEIQRLLRLVGVAVQRNAGPEALWLRSGRAKGTRWSIGPFLLLYLAYLAGFLTSKYPFESINIALRWREYRFNYQKNQ